MEILTHTTPVAKIPKPTAFPPNEAEAFQTSQSVPSSGNRSRKSLVFNSPSTKELPQTTNASKASGENITLGSQSQKALKPDSPVTQNVPHFDLEVLDQPQIDDKAVSTIMNNCLLPALSLSNTLIQQEVEETPPSDYESSGEEEEEEEETPATSRSAKRFSSESSDGSNKSNKIRMTPSLRYPALANSTVVAGGAPFSKEPLLSMSPILVEKDRPSRVQATPLTPVPAFNRKPIRAVSQSPLFMNVMQKTISKAAPQQKLATPQQKLATPQQKLATPEQKLTTPEQKLTTPEQKLTTPEQKLTTPEQKLATPKQNLPTPSNTTAPSTNPRKSDGGSTLVTPKSTLNSKGSSRLNPLKGKSLVRPGFDEIPESSDTEWEDLEDYPKVKPSNAIQIALEGVRVPLSTICISLIDNLFYLFSGY